MKRKHRVSVFNQQKTPGTVSVPVVKAVMLSALSWKRKTYLSLWLWRKFWKMNFTSIWRNQTYRLRQRKRQGKRKRKRCSSIMTISAISLRNNFKPKLQRQRQQSLTCCIDGTKTIARKCALAMLQTPGMILSTGVARKAWILTSLAKWA